MRTPTLPYRSHSPGARDDCLRYSCRSKIKTVFFGLLRGIITYLEPDAWRTETSRDAGRLPLSQAREHLLGTCWYCLERETY